MMLQTVNTYICIIHYIFNRQTYSADLEQTSLNFTKLQERFRNVVNKSKLKDSQRKKAYSEVEDTVLTLNDYKQ